MVEAVEFKDPILEKKKNDGTHNEESKDESNQN